MRKNWRPLSGIDTMYHISSCGLLKSFKRGGDGNLIKPKVSKRGYLVYNIPIKSKTKSFLAHRLVGIYFIPNTDGKPQINHKDGDKKNNKVSNLEWVTNSQNGIHAFRTGLRKHTDKQKLGILKYNHSKRKEVHQYSLGGIYIQSFESIVLANDKTGVSKSAISGCCRKVEKTAGSFVWTFIKN